jgi:hypothetical protein
VIYRAFSPVSVGRSLRGFPGPGLAGVHRRLPSLRTTNVPERLPAEPRFAAAIHNPAGRASSASTVGDFRRRFPGEKLCLFLRPLS